MEPSGADVPAGRPAHGIAADLTTWLRPISRQSELDAVTVVRVAATAAALVLTAASTGDVLLVGVVLGVAALDVLTGAVAVAAGLATLFRWGTTSLTAVAGAQAVLGPGGTVGPTLAAASAWLAAAALVLVAPRSLGPAVALGLAGAALVFGAAPPHFLAARVGVTCVVVAAALTAGRRLPVRPARRAAVTAALAACCLAALA